MIQNLPRLSRPWLDQGLFIQVLYIPCKINKLSPPKNTSENHSGRVRIPWMLL
jgi:hypothetical protein